LTTSSEICARAAPQVAAMAKLAATAAMSFCMVFSLSVVVWVLSAGGVLAVIDGRS
jgi:hypothetical protein